MAYSEEQLILLAKLPDYPKSGKTEQVVWRQTVEKQLALVSLSMEDAYLYQELYGFPSCIINMH